MTILAPALAMGRHRGAKNVFLPTESVRWHRLEALRAVEFCTIVQPYNQDMEGLTTAKLAKQGGVNVETIRYYERHGLLPKVARTPSGYRKFSADHVTRLRFIRRAQELGFSLREVKELLAIRLKPDSSCADVRRKAEAKIADVEERIRHLQVIREALGRMTATCAGRGPLTNCSILEALNGQGEL
jgi:MerR family mercuric resistance operon transcriptional regulator